MRIEGIFQNLATFNLWGLLIAGILLVANRFFPLPIPIGFAIALPIIVASAIAVGLGLLRKIDPFEVARFVDQRLNLKERLGTALEAMDRRNAGDFAILQIRDAARAAQEIFPATVVSYTVPRTLKWLPIPMLLVGLSLFIPRMYELPPPLNPAEHAAIHDAAARLEGAVSDLNNKSELSKQVEETAKVLRNKRTGAQAAQKKLSELREEVQAQKSQLAENELGQAVETISKLSENSNLLSGANAAEIASELEKLADQMDGLTEAQRAELDALLRQLAERLGGNPAAKNLVDQLNEIGTAGVSPEMLAKIARSLLDIDQQAKDIAQLENILEEIKTSRKNIGLAGIEMARKTGGVAGSDGGPGEESGTGEARGTQVEAVPPETQPTEALQLRGATSDSEEFATASTQEAPSGEEEPTYMPHREAYLNARQAYAEAMERDRIPVRYRQRVKDYLDAIANAGE
jgi:HPt (histidine-containing phosphotransfer) domain-containing protein